MTTPHRSAPTRKLPKRPNLRQLKKQAKELRKGFAAGDPGVVQEIGAHYHGADPATFKLGDAQLVLARAYGFTGWADLKRDVTVSVQKPFPLNASADEERQSAHALRRALAKNEPEAIRRVLDFHPAFADANDLDVRAADLSLDDCLLTVAREYGLESWPKLEAFIDMVNSYWSSPESDVLPTESDDPEELAEDFLRLACLKQGGDGDSPRRWEKARQLLAAKPEIAGVSIYTAAAVGDVAAAHSILSHNPELARTQGGPHHWEPLLYLAYSRLNSTAPGHSALETARILLDHGADPNAGFLWAGMLSPYTALAGVFSEGDCGPANLPAHPHWRALATMLLDAGADPNDSQALYFQFFSRNNDHLKLMLDYGLGTDQGGPWVRRLGSLLWARRPSDMINDLLVRATRWPDMERIKLLVAHGADVNHNNNRADTRTPYEEALYHGNLDIARYLQEQGAQETALGVEHAFVAACNAGDADRARALLTEHPTLIEQLRSQRKALLESAIETNNQAGVRTMVALGFDVNAATMHDAASKGNLDMIKLLIGLGAHVNVLASEYHSTALGFAHYFRQRAVTDYLLPLCDIHDAVALGRPDRVRALLDEDPQRINANDGHGGTPLHHLHREMEHGEEIIHLLIENGADVNAKDHDGRTPLDRLVNEFNLIRRDDLAAVLREHGAVECTGIFAAVEHDRPARVRTLLEESPKAVRDRDETGHTALHYLHKRTKHGAEIIDLLVAHGADVNAKTHTGMTALDKMESTGRPDLADRLRAHGA